MKNYKPHDSNILAWVAILLSTVAFIVSLVGYTQTQGGPAEVVKDLQLQVETIKQKEAVNSAVKALEDLQKGVKSGAIKLSEAEDRLIEIRSDLSLAFQNAGAEAQQAWKKVDDELALIGKNIKGGTVTVLDQLEKAVRNLKLLLMK